MKTKKELPDYELIYVKASRIYVKNDENGYQRQTNCTRVKKICDDYNKFLVNPVKVYKQFNCYYAFDGQHTLTALKRLFGDDVQVACLLYKLNDIEAAELFEMQTGYSSNPTAKEKFKSKTFREDKETMQMIHICNLYSYDVSTDTPSASNITFRCIDNLEKAYGLLGDTDFEKMIRIIKQTWFMVDKSTDANIVKGLSQFIAKYGEKVSEKEMIKKFGKKLPIDIIREQTSDYAKAYIKGKRYVQPFVNIINSGKKEPVIQ